MNSDYEVYRAAAARVRHRWVQGEWSKDGGECLVQAILSVTNTRDPSSQEPPNTSLPMRMQLVLDAHLMRLRSYRRNIRIRLKRKLWCLTRRGQLEDCAIRWNDAPDRTADEVAAALDSLADRLEVAYLAECHQEYAAAIRPSTWPEVAESIDRVWQENATAEECHPMPGR